MVNRLLRKRLKTFRKYSTPISQSEIEEAKTVLFSVFARYGDSIISFRMIHEFMLVHPEKNCLVITSPQSYPYARRILPGAQILKVNKRNPIQMFFTLRTLSRIEPDLGFNPWGHGDDSEYFITYAKRFFFFKQCGSFRKIDNLYDRVRFYINLNLPETRSFSCHEIGGIDRSAVIAPLSTDPTKNIPLPSLQKLVSLLHERGVEQITIASPKKLPIDLPHFLFRKSQRNSRSFLELIDSMDLFIGVDSGPLHIADAIGKKAIGIFGPTSPETVLNADSTVMPWRDLSLRGVFCFVRKCHHPLCIERLFLSDDLPESKCYNIISPKSQKLEEKQCPLL